MNYTGLTFVSFREMGTVIILYMYTVYCIRYIQTLSLLRFSRLLDYWTIRLFNTVVNTRLNDSATLDRTERQSTAFPFVCFAFFSFPFLSSQGSPYNLDPEMPQIIDDYTAAMLEKEGKELSDLETEIVPAPFVQVFKTFRCPDVETFRCPCSPRKWKPFGLINLLNLLLT